MDANTNEVYMIPEVAKYLFEHGATLIVTDVPPGTDFGIDLKSWTTGDKFKGIKMIPPGIHFIHYSATDEFGECAPRIGFFHKFAEKDVVVKRWNNEAEEVCTEDVGEEIACRFKGDLHNLDKFLGPYPYGIMKQWRELSNQINDNIIARCQPLCGLVRSALELSSCNDNQSHLRSKMYAEIANLSGRLTEAKEDKLLPHLKPKQGTELRLTELPTKNYPDNATGAEITQHSLDSSYALNTFLEKMNEPIEIIGEMQFTFICFLLSQSLEAFDHWKKLVDLICGVEKAIMDHRNVYIEFLRNIEIQLTHSPQDILSDIVSNNNFIYQNLRKLFATIEINTDIDGRLKSESLRMRERLHAQYMWDFENLLEEDIDEKPVIVVI